MRSVITDFILMLSSSVGLSILVKATAILLLGLVVGALATGLRASWRHLVFATTFAAVLALPFVALSVPELPIEFAAAATTDGEPQMHSTVAPVLTSRLVEPGTVSSTVTSSSTTGAWSLPSLGSVVFLVCIGGAVVLLLLLMVDLLRVRHTRRHGLPSARLREMVEQLTGDRPTRVDIMLHEKIGAPVTFGFFRPAIMLPADAEDWTEPDLRRALIHELEHIRRGDWATQLAARAACAFYWFHPFVWIVWRKLCLEAERACDDAVVQTAESIEYAEQLVSLSRQLSGARNQPMLGMAKRSDLARRISSVLDVTRRRGRASLAAAAFAVFIGLTVVIAVGPLRAVAQVAAPAPPPTPLDKQSAQTGTPAVQDDHDGDGSGDGHGDGHGDGQGDGDGDAAGDGDGNGNGNGDGDGDGVGDGADDGDGDGDDDSSRNPLDMQLYNAAGRNDTGKARALIEQGANVNALLPGDGTPLIAAARGGHLDMVSLLLELGAKPNLGISGDGNPLQNAAQRGHRDVVVLLLERGAEIDAGVEGDGNALIMASGFGRVEIVNLLLDRGADIHKIVAGDENPIIKACEQGQLAVVKLLVARGADINSRVRVEYGKGESRVEEYRTPLSQARKNGHTAVVEYLISAGARQ